MPKYTPGPWIKDYNGTKGHIKSTAPHKRGWTPTVAKYDVYVTFGVAKRQFEYVIKDEEEREANGFLLAAAPEMYELLWKVRNNWRTLGKEEWDEIAKVLAKAKGK